jgi:hypothetical protein
MPSAEPYQPESLSKISAIPTDSFLDGPGPARDTKSSSSPHYGEAFAGTAAASACAGGAAMGEISNNIEAERVSKLQKNQRTGMKEGDNPIVNLLDD